MEESFKFSNVFIYLFPVWVIQPVGIMKYLSRKPWISALNNNVKGNTELSWEEFEICEYLYKRKLGRNVTTHKCIKEVA